MNVINHRNLYYTLVWDTTLKEKKRVVKGELIDKNTKLPEDNRMLYGTNSNDTFVVKLETFIDVIKYDVLTTIQSVRFQKTTEEVFIARDVRIIVWEGSETINLSEDKYRIMTPDNFDELVSHLSVKNDINLKAIPPELEENEVLFSNNDDIYMPKSILETSNFFNIVRA